MYCVAVIGMTDPSERRLGNARILCASLVPHPGTGLLRELDAIDHFEERLGARLDDVRTDTRAAITALIVLDVDDRLALRILAFGHAAHFELAERDGDAGGGFDRLERRIDRTISGHGAIDRPAVDVLKANVSFSG